MHSLIFERGMLHVDTFTVLDGTLYSKIELGGAAKWHQSMDDQNDHPVNLDHTLSVFCFFQLLQLVAHSFSTFHGTSSATGSVKAHTHTVIA